MPFVVRYWVVALAWASVPSVVHGQQTGTPPAPEITLSADNVTIDRSTRIKKGTYVVADVDGNGVLQTPRDDVVLAFQGATLTGVKSPAAGNKDQYSGYGVAVNGHKNVVVKNAKVHGYQYGVRAVNCDKLRIEDCDLSHSRGE